MKNFMVVLIVLIMKTLIIIIIMILLLMISTEKLEVLEHYLKSSKKKKNFMASFHGWGSTASRLEPLRGGSLLFITKFSETPGTHFIDLRRMKR